MKVKKIPMRTCVVTKEKCEKKDLIRVVRSQDGTVEVDLTGKKNGRGAYLKKDATVFAKAKASGILERVLDVKVNDDLYEELNNLLK